MNQTLIKQYEISFENKLFVHPILHVKSCAYYSKVVDTNMLCLTDFLNDWSAAEIEGASLISEIDQVLDGSISELETGSDTFSVIVGPVMTVFYIDEVEQNYPKMPTQDFREIVVAWKDYLES